MSDLSTELLNQVADALASKTPLAISGGGSKADCSGRILEAANLQTLNMAAHSGIIDYNPTELVLTARAGTTLAEINATLEKEGQMLSFEPPVFNGKATLGGTLASNASGPARPWCGSIRDMVLGIQLINGKAELLNFGGQVMKNVAGYDVSRLQAGALGTLGVLTQISLKVLPAPEYSATLVYELDATQALQQMNIRSGQAKPLSAACWIDGKLYLRLSGTQTAITHTAQQWGGERLTGDAELWCALREFEHPFFAGDDALWRLSHGPTAAVATSLGDSLIDWGGAQRWVRGEQDHSALVQTAENAGGHVSLFRGGDRSSEVNHPLNTVQKNLQLRLKYAFDPEGLFNPGRLYSWM